MGHVTVDDIHIYICIYLYISCITQYMCIYIYLYLCVLYYHSSWAFGIVWYIKVMQGVFHQQYLWFWNLHVVFEYLDPEGTDDIPAKAVQTR